MTTKTFVANKSNNHVFKGNTDEC